MYSGHFKTVSFHKHFLAELPHLYKLQLHSKWSSQAVNSHSTGKEILSFMERDSSQKSTNGPFLPEPIMQDHFNINFPFMSRSPKLSLHFSFSKLNFVFFILLSCYKSYPPHSS